MTGITRSLRDLGAVGAEDGEGVAVELRGPAGEVHDVMMVVAERHEIDEVGRAAVLPMDDVMGAGPAVGSAASAISTPVVADA